MFVPQELEKPKLASLNGILGTAVSDSVIAEMNASMGNPDFYAVVGGQRAEAVRLFTQQVVLPQRTMALKVKDTQLAITRADVIRPLLTREDLLYVPPSMQLPILLMPEVAELHRQGRAEGFGYYPEDLDGVEDVFGRLINNGTVENCLAAIDPVTDTIALDYVWKSTDPELSVEQIDAIEQTRLNILNILATTDFDPTDIRNRLA